VTAEKLAGVEARLADAQAREQQTAVKLAEVEKTAKTAFEQADQFRYRFMEADSKARELEKEAKTAATRATAAEQRAGEAERVAAELRGKLDALKGDKKQ
jgi:chromosome segregation ATPase